MDFTSFLDIEVPALQHRLPHPRKATPLDAEDDTTSEARKSSRNLDIFIFCKDFTLPAISEHITRSIFGWAFGRQMPRCGKVALSVTVWISLLANLLPQQNNFSCRIKSPSTAATKGAALRTPYVFTSNTLCLFLKDPMSLSQRPHVFSLKTCAPTRYTPVYPSDTHLCTHLIHTCVPTRYTPVYPKHPSAIRGPNDKVQGNCRGILRTQATWRGRSPPAIG